MDFTVFRNNLVHLKDSRGLSSKALAEHLDVSIPTITRYVLGQRSPDLTYVIKLADYFNVSVDWLLGRTDNQNATIADEVKEITDLYMMATADDRNVVNAVLNKYRS